jgi:hypothetical protein
MMMMKTRRRRRRRRNEMPNLFGDEVCEIGSAWSFCRPASSLVKSSVLRIEAAVAGGVERKDALVRSRKTLPTPGQVLLERLTRDNGISNSGAMDELDLERGVCNPFRKYSPESVSYTILFFSPFLQAQQLCKFSGKVLNLKSKLKFWCA